MLDFASMPRSTFFDREVDQTLLCELADLRTVPVSLSVKVGYLLLNRHLIGEKPAVVSIGGILGDLSMPDRGYEGASLATGLDRPILMLDIPGHGKSTRHSAKQIKDLCIERSADSQAAPLTEAVQKLLNPNDPLDYFGISHGSLLVLKLAEQDPIDRGRTIFGLDIPGTKKIPTAAFQYDYNIRDNFIGGMKYRKALRGSQQEADFEKFKALHDTLGIETARKFIINNFGLFVLNLFASVNATPVALDAWKNIMATKSATVHAVTSANGSVSDPQAIEAFISQMPANYQARSHQTVIAGENHNIGRVHLLPRTVEWARQAYNSVA